MIHLRFEGRSYEVSPRQLELTAPADDRTVLNRVARWLGVDSKRMSGYVIDRRPGGQIVVRPEAIYG